MDAILIPGGGLTPDGKPTEWVRARLDRAVNRWSGELIITLSAGTTHKAPPVDADGFPIFESVAGARYLVGEGIPADKILFETSSYDTIGNAWFARALHTDPLGADRLLVITSEFHLPRVRAVFDWVFGASPSDYLLRYEAVPNVGIDEKSLRARIAKEQEAIGKIAELRRSLSSTHEIRHWLFTQHSAYSISRPTPSAGEADTTY